MKSRNNCEICKDANLVKFLELGNMPHAGSFPSEGQLDNEKLYPLEVYFCKDCGLVQLLDIIPADVLFKEYRYLSSTSRTLSEHFRKYSKVLKDKFNLGKTSLVVEFGSNDGVLLSPLRDLGIKAIGVEPAKNIAEVAVWHDYLLFLTIT